MPWSGNLLKHPYLEVDASLKGLYHTSVGMLRGLLKLQNHWMVYLPQVEPIPRRIGISPTNGRQSIRMRLMPWSGNLLKHPYLDDFSEPCCLDVDASLKGLYHTSVGMLRGLLKLQNHWMAYLDDILIYILGRLQWAMLPRSWRKFERIISYLRRYVEGFAKIAKSFNCLLATGSTKNNRNITNQWTPECQDAFDALKWKLVETPIPGWLQWAMLPRSWRKFERIISYLRRYVKEFAKIAKPLNGLLGWHPYIYLDDFSEPCCLEVDASFKEFRATLSQKVVGRKIVLRGLRY